MISLDDTQIREVVRPREEPNAIYEAATSAQFLEEDRSAS